MSRLLDDFGACQILSVMSVDVLHSAKTRDMSLLHFISDKCQWRRHQLHSRRSQELGGEDWINIYQKTLHTVITGLSDS